MEPAVDRKDSAAGADATSRRNPRELNQANPNKTKQKWLVLFGFIWRNRDFSMGYSRKN
jgi:hypothetical protein